MNDYSLAKYDWLVAVCVLKLKNFLMLKIHQCVY